MILRKPYAFLIKYFKLIHIILASLMAYIAYRTYNIISFFNEYIINDYVGNYYKGFSSSYISPFIYLIIVIILVGILSIYLLFLYKKKPSKIYISSIVYYIIAIIFLVFIKNVMLSIETTIITAESARIYRDLSIILFIPQTVLIIMYLFRGLGFNFKKFNFEQDLKELEITSEDDEEVEITLNKDNVKLKRNIYRFIREFKYYIKENKFIFIIICIVLTGTLVYLIYNMFPEIIDRKYNQGDNFTINNLNYKIEDSIITNLDYKGELINEKYYYLVTKLNIENLDNEDTEIDYNNFRLVIDDEYVYPKIDKEIYFIDYAVKHNNSIVKAKTNGTYLLVFEIEEEYLRKNYEIKIFNGSTISDNLIIGRHNYISISPIVINKVNLSKNVNTNEELNFSDSNLGNTSIRISNPNFTDKYVYDYEYCKNDKCNTYKDIVNIDYLNNNTTLLVLDYKYEIDNEVPFYNYSSSINTFIKNFMKIKYVGENKKSLYASIKDVTPSKLKNQLIIETTKDVTKSEIIELSFIIRNKEYLIKIK